MSKGEFNIPTPLHYTRLHGTEHDDTISIEDGVYHIDLWYPSYDKPPATFVEVGLMSVRATDGVRVHYDFDRDGFVVSQPCSRDIPEEWAEVGFFKSWALDNGVEEED